MWLETRNVRQTRMSRIYAKSHMTIANSLHPWMNENPSKNEEKKIICTSNKRE